VQTAQTLAPKGGSAAIRESFNFIGAKFPQSRLLINRVPKTTIQI
jgi:hypothetical protein